MAEGVALMRAFALTLLAAFLAHVAHAGTKVINVELGASTLEQVRKEAALAGRIQNAGTSTWSKGPILQVYNPDLGIDGVTSVQYIFDAAGQLAAVVMTMPSTKGMVIWRSAASTKSPASWPRSTSSPRRSVPVSATATPSSPHPTPSSRSTPRTCPSTWKCAT